ncbi:MAG: hypothetical protein GEV03_07605 [Streptosporangiales bacterium]|nr:hypothetical protein [Streptosporangiales bacterium]
MELDAIPQLVLDGLLTGSFYAMLAVSFGLIFATTRTFHFAHALTLTAGAYAAVVVGERGLPFVLALLAAGAVGGAVGWLTDAGLYRPLRRRGALSLNIFLASLGLLIAGEAVIQFVFGPNSRPLRGFTAAGLQAGPIATGTVQVVMAGVSWGLVILVACFLHFTRYGLAVRGVESNAFLAEAFGIDRGRIFGLVFAIGSVMAGVGGALLALQDTATPTMGLAPILAAFIAVFIGGIGSVAGAVIGGVLLGLLEHLGGIVLPGYLQTIVAFVLLFVVLLVRPSGLVARARG